jgi:cytochrome c-type biogenesis protein CcmH
MTLTLPVALFWALSVSFVAIAVAIVLRPLLKRRDATPATGGRQAINIAVYRDQLHELELDRDRGLLDAAQFEAAKLELEARLAEDALREPDSQPVSRGGRHLGYALAAAIPVAAFGLYTLLGNPDAILQPAVSGSHAQDGHNLEAMLAAVEAKAKADPNDPKPQVLLAKTLAALERWPEAVAAYERATRLVPEDASLWASYAEAVALMQERDLRGKPMELVRKALAIDPEEPTALNLAGIHAFMEGDYATALNHWQALLKRFPPGSEEAEGLKAAMTEARSRAAAAGISLDAPKTTTLAAPAISGRVELAPSVKTTLPPGATLYVFARPLSGGGPPVAVFKARADRLPMPFALDDRMSMNPEQQLSSLKEVAITARVSLTGQPMASKGDLEGSLAPVKLGSQDVRLVIDRVVQ